MGHLALIVLHGIATLSVPWLLFVTIPLHVIYSAVQKADRPTEEARDA